MAKTRSFVVTTIVLMLATPASAAGWTTVVRDMAGGMRVAGMTGIPSDNPGIGLAVACDADSTLPPVLTAVFPPSGKFSSRPGDAAILKVAGLRFSDHLKTNDSAQLSIQIELSDTPTLMKTLDSASDGVTVSIESGDLQSSFIIPTTGLSESLAQIAQACPKLTG